MLNGILLKDNWVLKNRQNLKTLKVLKSSSSSASIRSHSLFDHFYLLPH